MGGVVGNVLDVHTELLDSSVTVFLCVSLFARVGRRPSTCAGKLLGNRGSPEMNAVEKFCRLSAAHPRRTHEPSRFRPCEGK